MITPALSVLSAVEGLKLVTPALGDYVLAISTTILLALFLVQSRGTAAVSSLFGPITVLWFLVMGAGGLAHIADDATILNAINPLHAVYFITHAGFVGLIVLGAVFLTVTGLRLFMPISAILAGSRSSLPGLRSCFPRWR